MSAHDRFAATELINRWWFNYDEGHLEALDELLADDCHLSSRTELGTHPTRTSSDPTAAGATMRWPGPKSTAGIARIRFATMPRTSTSSPSVATSSTSTPTCS